MIRRALFLAVALLVLASSAFCQGARLDGVATVNVFGVQHVVANATIRVCSAGSTGSPCSPLASIYSDVALTVPLVNPFNADANGNYHFFASSTVAYDIQISGTGIATITQTSVTLSCPSGCSGLSSNNAFTGNNTHSGTETFNVNAIVANAGIISAGPNTLNGGGTTAGSWTHAGLHTFNLGLTSSGPNTLNGGGVFSGTYSGNHTLTGTATFSNLANLNGGGALNGSFSGPTTLTGNVTATSGQNNLSTYAVNKIIHVDGLKYACSNTGIAAAIADAGVNSKVIVDGCSGSVPMAGIVTLPEGVDLVLGAATYAPSVCPAFDLTGGGSTLEGQGPGSPTMNISPTVIQAASGCTGPLIRVNIGAGAKGGYLHDFMLDGNNKLGTVTAAIELGSVSQVNRNIIERVSFNQFGTAILADVGSQSQRLSHLHASSVNIGLDLSSGQHKDFVVEFSRFICDVQCFIAGKDDAVAGNVSNNISFTGTDFEIPSTASAATNIGTVNNVLGFHVLGGWYEINGGATVSGTSLVKLGGAVSTPVAVSIIGAHFNGNNHATATHAIEFNSVSFPLIFGNDISNNLSQAILVTSSISFGEVFGNNDNTVSSRTGLVFVLGDTILSNPQWKTPILMEGANGTAMLAMSKTGDANPTLRLLNSGNIVTGPGGATTPLVMAACGTTAGVCTFQNAPVMGGTAAGLAGTGACGTITTQKGGAWGGEFKCTGTTGASTFTITPGYTAPNGWNCRGSQDQTTVANTLNQTSQTATTCVLTGATITQNDVIIFSALPY